MATPKFTFKPSKEAIKSIDSKCILALEKTVEYLHTEVVQAQVMPFDTGHMQNESTFVKKKSSTDVSLIVSAPYAERLYYGDDYDFVKASNPNAQSRWFSDWIDGNKKDDCRKFYEKMLKEGE